MSTRTYNLRARTGTGLANWVKNQAQKIPTSQESVLMAQELASHLADTRITKATIALHTYSDVVASRPPSPRKETQEYSLEGTSDAEERGASHQVNSHPYVVGNSNRNNDGNNSPDNVSEHSRSQDNANWTTVRRRHARSLSSLDRTWYKSPRKTSKDFTNKTEHLKLQLQPWLRNKSSRFSVEMRKYRFGEQI